MCEGMEQETLFNGDGGEVEEEEEEGSITGVCCCLCSTINEYIGRIGYFD